MTAFDGFWYRYEIRRHSVADEWGDHLYTTTNVHCNKYAVVRETPKGVWLVSVTSSTSDPDSWRGVRHRIGQRFVLGTSLRQEACPTKEAALEDAIQRKARHVQGCQTRLASAQSELAMLRRTRT